MFKGIGNLASLMKNASEITGKMGDMSKELQEKRVTATAGGDMIQIEMNGLNQVTKVKIDPSLIENNETEMIEDLLMGAFNQGVQKAKQLNMEMMQGVTGGLTLPGLDKAFEQLTGGQDPDDDSESKSE